MVGTPIGNMEDITLRAIRILKEVDLILCEDTRTTGHLLKAYDINTKTASYHTKSSISRIKDNIVMLKEGKNIALVSDAGTPGISDPGSLLISKIHEYNLSKDIFDTDKIRIISIPGPSALISALSISGFMGGGFVFEGFLPHKKGRETIFKKIVDSKETHVFYESPHRILKTLESIDKYMPERKIMLARELTKLFEETLIGTAKEIKNLFKELPEKVKGEFVVIIYDR